MEHGQAHGILESGKSRDVGRDCKHLSLLFDAKLASEEVFSLVYKKGRGVSRWN